MTWYWIVSALALAWLVYEELRRDLMMLQQNSYIISRYYKWLRDSGDSTSMPRLLCLVLLFVSLGGSMHLEVLGVFMLPAALFIAYKLHVKKYKHALVNTKRVLRLWAVVAILAVVAPVLLLCLMHWPASIYWTCIALLGAYVASHILVVIANVALQPVERAINRGFIRDAARILRSMPELKVIGITGSYGKTSTKHYLTRILAEKYDVLMTPGSYNTTLGVVRTVREMMKPYNEVFVCEMGAKNIGDIKEICDLVHPTIGIVTAVGPQHLESFKTIENVQRTKFELVDALPADGLAIINDDFEYIANRPVDNTQCIRYAVTHNGGAKYTATNIEYSASGTTFTVEGPDGFSLPLATRLVGECNISNLTAAVICAIYLGVEPQKIQYAVSKIEQVEHRLNVKRTPAGITIIDDAFNSNPSGSRMALEVLARFTGGKRIVVTPGMIELGDQQDDLNAALGATIARCADVAIIVGQYNREPLMAGCHQGLEQPGATLTPANLHAVDTFAQAQQLLATIAAPGDTVLYENDLPDTFK